MVIREIPVDLHTIVFPPHPIAIDSEAAQIRFVFSLKNGSIISYLSFICSSIFFLLSLFIIIEYDKKKTKKSQS